MPEQLRPDIHYRLIAGMEEVRQALDRMKRELTDAQVDAELVEATQIILAEVLNNVVEHAYRFAEGQEMEVSVWCRPEGLACEVCDEGIAMPSGRVPNGRMPPVDREDLPEGGFGWALVHDMTRDLDYRRVNGRNHLSFLIPLVGWKHSA